MPFILFLLDLTKLGRILIKKDFKIILKKKICNIISICFNKIISPHS